MISVIRQQWEEKPDVFLEVDWSHPLCEDLEFFSLLLSDGKYAEFSRGSVTKNGSYSTVITTRGAAIQYTGSGNTRISAYPELDPNGDYSWACGYDYNGGTPSSYARPFGRTANNGSSPYVNWDFELWPGGSTGTISAGAHNSFTNIGTSVGVTPSGGLSVGYHTLIGSVSSGQLTCYIDKDSSSTSITSNSAYLTGGNDVYFGGDSPAGYQNISGSVLWGAFWSKSLSSEKIEMLRENAFQILIPRLLKIPTTSINAIINLSGVLSAGGIGNMSASASADVAVTGNSTTGLSGSISAVGAAVASVPGVSSATSIGSLSITGGAIAAVTGIAASGGVGSLSIVANALASLSGIDATGQPGNLAVFLSGGATVSITGVSISGNIGGLSAIGGAVSSPSNVSTIGQVGIITATIAETIIVTGVNAVGQIGTLVINQGATVSIAGVMSIAGAGAITILIPSDIVYLDGIITITPVCNGSITLKPALDGNISINNKD